MITFILVGAFAVLLVGIVAVLYFGGRRSKADETGRVEARAQTSQQPRANGREA